MRAMIIVWVHRSWLEQPGEGICTSEVEVFFSENERIVTWKGTIFWKGHESSSKHQFWGDLLVFVFFFLEDHHLKKHQFYDSKNSVYHFSKTTLCRLGLKLTALNVSFSQPWSCRSNGGWRCVFGPTSGANFVPTFSQEAPPAIISLYPGQAAAFQLLDWNVYIFWIDAGGWHHFGNLLSISCRAVIDNVYAFFQKPDPCQIRWIWRTSASPCLVQVFFRRVPSRLKKKVHQLAWEMFWCCGRDLKIHLWDFNVIAAVTQL